MEKKEKEIRTALADYMVAEGCSCCRDDSGHEKAKGVLAKLLKVPKYKHGGGYDFYKFKSKN